MKLLHTIASLRSEDGGPSRTVPAVCKALAAIPPCQVWLHSQRRADEQPQVSIENVTTSFSRMRSKFLPSSQFREDLVSLVREKKIEILHDHGQWLASNRISAATSARFGLPRVVSPRGMLSPWALSHRRFKKAVAWTLYAKRDIQSAKLVHATSPLERDELRALGIRNSIAVIPNAVNVEEFEIERSIPRKKQLLFLSRLHPKKGLADLVEAWARLRPAGWKVIIAGPDENGHRAEVEKLASRAKVDFKFVGSVDGTEKSRLYQESSIFVLPTYSENFGVVIAEALCCETPVITTNVTPWTEIAESNLGWYIPPGADALTKAISAAIKTPTCELEGMGKRGRKAIINGYSWSAVADQLHQAYAWVLGKGDVPNCVDPAK